jgi:hypothetical protein
MITFVALGLLSLLLLIGWSFLAMAALHQDSEPLE